jgi:hypothetical protein
VTRYDAAGFVAPLPFVERMLNTSFTAGERLGPYRGLNVVLSGTRTRSKSGI